VPEDPTTPVTAVIERESRETVVMLAGELDASGRDDVERVLLEAERSEPQRLVIDIRDLTFIDSAGITCVLRARERAGEAQHRLRVVARSDRQPAEVFRICGLDSLLELEEGSAAQA
jgi:anti-anti-sigma factor